MLKRLKKLTIRMKKRKSRSRLIGMLMITLGKRKPQSLKKGTKTLRIGDLRRISS